MRVGAEAMSTILRVGVVVSTVVLSLCVSAVLFNVLQAEHKKHSRQLSMRLLHGDVINSATFNSLFITDPNGERLSSNPHATSPPAGWQLVEEHIVSPSVTTHTWMLVAPACIGVGIPCIAFLLAWISCEWKRKPVVHTLPVP